MGDLPPYARAWLEQRQTAAKALEEIEKEELASLSDDVALRQSEALLSAAPRDLDEERIATSGFVEQQRVFMRHRNKTPDRA